MTGDRICSCSRALAATQQEVHRAPYKIRGYPTRDRFKADGYMPHPKSRQRLDSDGGLALDQCCMLTDGDWYDDGVEGARSAANYGHHQLHFGMARMERPHTALLGRGDVHCDTNASHPTAIANVPCPAWSSSSLSSSPPSQGEDMPRHRKPATGKLV